MPTGEFTTPCATQSPRRAALCVLACALISSPLRAQPHPQSEIFNPQSPSQAILHRLSAATTLALPSGIHVHIRTMTGGTPPERGNTDPRIHVVMLVPGLELFETPANRGVASLAIQSLQPPPNAPFRARAAPAPEGLSVRITCSKAQTPDALFVLASILTNPTLDAARFETIRAATIQNRARAQSQNQRVAEAMMNLMVRGDDPRLRRPTTAELAALNFADTQAFLTAHLAQRPVDVAIVGDITLPEILPAIESTLAPLPPRPRDRLDTLRNVPRAVNHAPPAPLSLPGPMPAGQALVSLSLPAPALSDIHEARTAAVAARLLQAQTTEALKTAGLPIRLSTAVAMTGRVYPQLGATVASFMIDADEKTAARAAAIVTSTIHALTRDGPTPEATRHAIDDALAEIEPRLKSPDYWASSLSSAWFLGVDIDDLAGAPQDIRAVTPATLREHLVRWWSPQGLIQITLIADAPPPQLPQQNPPFPPLPEP